MIAGTTKGCSDEYLFVWRSRTRCQCFSSSFADEQRSNRTNEQQDERTWNDGVPIVWITSCRELCQAATLPRNRTGVPTPAIGFGNGGSISNADFGLAFGDGGGTGGGVTLWTHSATPVPSSTIFVEWKLMERLLERLTGVYYPFLVHLDANDQPNKFYNPARYLSQPKVFLVYPALSSDHHHQ
jgi:hypothetical protein